jgi:hypothetical protein
MTLYQLELDPVLQLADEQIIGPMPDRVIEFIVPNSEAAKAIDKEYWVKKERSREAEVPSLRCGQGRPHSRVKKRRSPKSRVGRN